MADTEASEPDAGEPTTSARAALGVWWRRLVADQSLQKVRSIIRVRQYELDLLLEDAKRAHIEPGELGLRLDRARQLVDEAPPTDRALANELLDKLDGVMPLVADDDRLVLMLESELERDETLLTEAARQRAHDLAGTTEGGVDRRRQLEWLVTAAIRERNDRLREERITDELRQNYLTWLGSALCLLLLGVAGVSILAAQAGLWADVVLALLAGALGGTLSGVIRLRAPESRLAALKSLGLVMFVQPLVGAVGGIVLFAIWKSGLLTVAGLKENEWASVAVVAFVGGFSERFFLRSLARIAGAPDQPRSAHPSDRNAGTSE
jgi:hypothetical protein